MGNLNAHDRKLLSDPNLVSVATVNPDGEPRVTCIWVDLTDDHILLNGTDRRNWLRNLRRSPKVALSLHDRQNIYQRINVIGEVESITSEGAEEHIDVLARKYTGAERYDQHDPDEPRVLVRVKPLKISRMGF